VRLRLPMHISTRTWPANKNAASVDYGPLGFSLAIKESWRKYGNRNPNWPEWEVLPASAWNYGLVLEERRPEKSFKIARRDGPVPSQPWTALVSRSACRRKPANCPSGIWIILACSLS